MSNMYKLKLVFLTSAQPNTSSTAPRLVDGLADVGAHVVHEAIKVAPKLRHVANQGLTALGRGDVGRQAIDAAQRSQLAAGRLRLEHLGKVTMVTYKVYYRAYRVTIGPVGLI